MTNARITLFALAALVGAWSDARAGWAVGVHFGGPFYGHYRPYYGYPRPYYAYPPPYYAYPVVVAPPAVVGEAAVVLRPPVAAHAAPEAPPAYPGDLPVKPVPVVDTGSGADADLRQLDDPAEGVRSASAMRLGRGRSQAAVPGLTRLLRGDPSPRVRDAAARALGLIAAPASLQTLQDAAQADDDGEVRASARFAAGVIRGR